ncbi:nuclear pore complex Nup93 [Brachionus plicatilis]|uniref:Nuclear pore protein n=1 Tax=Brachionus plicatilis TaxID=10195 RepID=A0A3M7REP2_BRAPC|nr:nuclear pore complex Nup93 [Brachionus plicatilis]
MSDIDFNDLLRDAEQMSAQIDKENTGIPRLQRTLTQIHDVTKKKLAKTSNILSTDSNEINASILLAAKGIDAPKLTQTIEGLNIQPFQPAAKTAQTADDTISPFDKLTNIEHLRDVDLASFLKSEKESVLTSIIAEARQKTNQEIEDSFSASNEIEWEKQKQKIMTELLGSFNPEVSVSNTTTSTYSNRQTAFNPQARTLMNDIELEFARQIYLYNQKILTNEKPRPDLIKNFASFIKKLNDKNLEDLWDMINTMTNLPAMDYDEKLNYLDRNNAEKTQSSYVNQAINHLERSFKDLIQNTVNANLKQAKLGGGLGTLRLVSGYLRLSSSEKYHQFSEETFDDKQPLWPTIYLCIRCGDIEAAKTVALNAKKEEIANYLNEITKDSANNGRGRLNNISENKLKIEYKSKIKRVNDAYKRAVYCYLSRYSGDDDSINEVLDNVDDFLWFKLNSVVFKKEPNSDNMTFHEFQSKMSVEFGEKYFTQNRNPFIYLQVLLLTAQFELAVEFLLKYESMIVHGVHMAIGLFDKQMLNILKNPASSQLIVGGEQSEPKSLRRINLPFLIRMYTRKFECTDPREALEYYFFLRNLKVSTQISGEFKRISNYFALYISELALETREFEVLFGRLEKNAVRKPGVIDKFSSDEEANSIISLVAEEIENKGLIEEAVKLYDLCKQHQRVLELCNKLTSVVVTEINVPNSNRDRLKNMVMSIALRYKTETAITSKAIPKSIITTFYLLVDLMTFFDLYHAQSWETAYETLNKLNILPATSSNVDSKVKDFVAFSEEIKRNFPDLILAAMTIMSNLYSKINSMPTRSSGFQSSAFLLGTNNEKKSMLDELKEQARSLIKFVGCIPYRLSGDINARLLQLEVMMN